MESSFEHAGLDCVVLAISMGHRCGYVRVPEGHPWHGVEYNQAAPEQLVDNEDFAVDDVGTIPAFLLALSDDEQQDEYSRQPGFQVRVHGGLTYSGEQPNDDCEKGHWFGFDCAHSEDAKDPELMSDRQKEVEAEMEARFGSLGRGTVRTREYVEDECRRLADQLVAVAEKAVS